MTGRTFLIGFLVVFFVALTAVATGMILSAPLVLLPGMLWTLAILGLIYIAARAIDEGIS